VASRHNVILLGDSLGDIGMSNGVQCDEMIIQERTPNATKAAIIMCFCGTPVRLQPKASSTDAYLEFK
jgi:hypothetical protein